MGGVSFHRPLAPYPSLSAWFTCPECFVRIAHSRSSALPRTPNIRLIEILVVCTGNTCRSPMAAALLSRRLDDAGVEAAVSSTGILFDGKPATDHGVAVMADRGVDTS